MLTKLDRFMLLLVVVVQITADYPNKVISRLRTVTPEELVLMIVKIFNFSDCMATAHVRMLYDSLTDSLEGPHSPSGSCGTIQCSCSCPHHREHTA